MIAVLQFFSYRERIAEFVADGIIHQAAERTEQHRPHLLDVRELLRTYGLAVCDHSDNFSNEHRMQAKLDRLDQFAFKGMLFPF
jgi:hypothetical protein